VLIRHMWQLKTVVFLHWCLIRAVLFIRSGKLTKCFGAKNRAGMTRHFFRST